MAEKSVTAFKMSFFLQSLIFKITKFVPRSVPSTDNESYIRDRKRVERENKETNENPLKK